MAIYRTDREETNRHGQVLGYMDWMGGRSISRIKNTVCPDGSLRTWFRTAEPDTFFSIPGYVHVKGKKVHGYVTVKDEMFEFTPNAY